MLHLLGHSVSLIRPVNGHQLHVLAKIKCKFKFGSILWQYVSNMDIGSLHPLYASGTMLNSFLHVCYLDLAAFNTLSAVVKYCFQNVGIWYVKYLIDTFCVYVFVLCVLVVVFGAEHLIW